MSEIESWRFGGEEITTIEQDTLNDPRASHKAATNALLPFLRKHARIVKVNDRGGLIVLFDEPVAGRDGEHFGGFRGFLSSRNRRQVSRMICDALGKIGSFGDREYIARRLATAQGDTIITLYRTSGPEDAPK